MLEICGTQIVDDFAEAFRMRYARLIVTACDDFWLDAALREFCGYGTSIIGCELELGVENQLAASETPDGRPGAAILAFGFSPERMAQVIPKRIGQTLMTCPTTAVFSGLDTGEVSLPLGKYLRYFGDGYQKSKLVAGRRYWRVPVMDGEFVIEATTWVDKGVAGGNFLLQGIDQATTLAAARRSVAAIATLPGVITPFPGGVVRSGSKVGSRYAGMIASTADRYCPTLRGQVPSALHPQANAVYEIVIDGVSEAAVAQGMVTGIRAAAGKGIVAISAGNYGGKLGKFHFHLHQLLAS